MALLRVLNALIQASCGPNEVKIRLMLVAKERERDAVSSGKWSFSGCNKNKSSSFLFSSQPNHDEKTSPKYWARSGRMFAFSCALKVHVRRVHHTETQDLG